MQPNKYPQVPGNLTIPLETGAVAYFGSYYRCCFPLPEGFTTVSGQSAITGTADVAPRGQGAILFIRSTTGSLKNIIKEMYKRLLPSLKLPLLNYSSRKFRTHPNDHSYREKANEKATRTRSNLQQFQM